MFIESQDESTVCISGIRLRNCHSPMPCHIALLKDSFITISFTLAPLGERTVPLPLEPMHSTCQWEPGLALLLCLAFTRMGRRAESSKLVSCHSYARGSPFPRRNWSNITVVWGVHGDDQNKAKTEVTSTVPHALFHCDDLGTKLQDTPQGGSREGIMRHTRQKPCSSNGGSPAYSLFCLLLNLNKVEEASSHIKTAIITTW